MTPQTFFIKTLGCKVNQYEAQGIREILEGDGYSEVDSPEAAAFIIINSCTVTHQSDRKTFYFMRRTKKVNAAATIVLTGCTTEKREHAELYDKGADIVVTNAEKEKIAQILTSYASATQPEEKRPAPVGVTTYNDMPISTFKGHSRAFIKIQDGCNMNCSYCKVRIVRGKSRSRSVRSIRDEAQRLVGNGYKEIVLAGVQLGAFGKDLTPQTSLVGLLELLVQEPGLERIRLSSLEPFDVSDALIACMAQNPIICPHLHLPLQSGDDSILRSMRRVYTRDQFLTLILKLREAVPGFALTTDVIVGFPGEDDTAFRNTLDLIERTEPFKIHIFPFSAREGTDACGFKDVPQAQVVKKREEELQKLNNALYERTSQALVGAALRVLIEEVTDDPPVSRGRLSDYRSVVIDECTAQVNDLVKVRILGVQKGYLVGAPLK